MYKNPISIIYVAQSLFLISIDRDQNTKRIIYSWYTACLTKGRVLMAIVVQISRRVQAPMFANVV